MRRIVVLARFRQSLVEWFRAVRKSCFVKRGLVVLVQEMRGRLFVVAVGTHLVRKIGTLAIACHVSRCVVATRMALLSKFQDEQAVLLSDWQCGEPKTKVVVQALKSLGVDGGSVLLVTNGVDSNVLRSARNIVGGESSSHQ